MKHRTKKLIIFTLIFSFLLSGSLFGTRMTTEAANGTWVSGSGGWWYRYSDGSYPKNTWEMIGGKWYHFNSKGYMDTGWKKISKKWYYFGTDGAMRTGWKKIGGKWYYFNNQGAMQTGWTRVSGKWYYLKAGVMVTGKQVIGGEVWWFRSDGSLIDDLSDAFALFMDFYASWTGFWHESVTINSDGTFSGEYSDSDMGDTGTNYPNGTVYVSKYTGKFKNIRKIDEYTYEMTVESISYEAAPGKIWYENGTKYVGTAMEYWDVGETVYMYMTGKPSDDLPQGFKSWAPKIANGKLAGFALYNVYYERAFMGALG